VGFVRAGGIGQFIVFVEIGGVDVRAQHGVEILRDLVVRRNISVHIVFVISAQPFVGDKPGVIVPEVLEVILLDAFLAGLPVIAEVAHIEVGAAPDGEVINETIGAVGQVGIIGCVLLVVIHVNVYTQSI